MYSFVGTQVGDAVSCLVGSPAVDVLAVGFESGLITLLNIRYDEPVLSPELHVYNAGLGGLSMAPAWPHHGPIMAPAWPQHGPSMAPAWHSRHCCVLLMALQMIHTPTFSPG